MPAGPASTLTAREQAVANFLRQPRIADISMAIAAAVLGVIARALAQAYCATTPTAPLPGTDGGDYCTTVSHGWSWVTYAAAAGVIACSIRWIARRGRH